MQLLILGASGFLGKNIVRLATQTGWETVGTFQGSRSFPKWAQKNGCRPIRYDLLTGKSKLPGDVCIYAAGNSSHLESVRNPVRDLRLNVEALARFLNTFRGGLVYISSAAVYEGHVGRVGPQECLRPTMPYAISKRTSEAYIEHHVSKGNLNWATILRLYYAYGLFDRPERLVPRLVSATQSRARKFRITSSKGTLIDPLFAEDVARAALSAATGRCANSTLDLCGGRPRPVPQFVREVIKYRGWTGSIVEVPRPDETPLRFYSSPNPARRKLNLTAFVTLENGLEKYVRWRNGQGNDA